MNIAAVIPARFDSVRFPGKPLKKILGISMLERVYRQVQKTGRFKDIIVATDDNRIADEVNKFGGQFALTSKSHKSGTERIWEILSKSNYDGVVNIQGDEPMIDEKLISDIYSSLKTESCEVVTAAFFNNSFGEFQSQNEVKVVVDSSGYAIYFSRSPIPFVKFKLFSGFLHHVGIYGYKRSAIEAFIDLPASELEQTEGLEQLRFIANRIPVLVLQSKYKSVGVDVPDDIKKIETLLRRKNG